MPGACGRHLGQPVGRGKVANGMAQLDFLEEYDASVPYELSAELPGAVATELKIADATGRATPSEGGGVQNEEGTINVRIPANVAPEALTLLLEELGEPDPAINTEWLLPAAAAAASVDASTYMTDVIIYRHYAIEGIGESGNVIEQLNGAFATDLRYAGDALAEDGMTPDDLYCLWFNPEEAKWVPAASGVDTGGKTLTCSTDKLGKFVLVGAKLTTPQPGDEHQVFLPLAVRP